MDRWRNTQMQYQLRNTTGISWFGHLIKLILTCLTLSSAVVGNVNIEDLKCSTIALCPGAIHYVDTRKNVSWIEMRGVDDEIANETHWNGFRPTEYNLSLNFQNFPNFVGTVTIRGEIVKPTRILSFNIHKEYIYEVAEKQSITCCSLTQPPQICLEYTNASQPYEYIELKLNDTLPTETMCSINLYFRNIFKRSVTINENAIGLRVFETDIYTVANTEFKLRDARKVFPCLDHPSLKARFNVTVICHNRFVVVGNNESVARKPIQENPGFSIHNFQVVVPIATHEFGFAMLVGYDQAHGDGDFENVRLVPPKRAISSPMRFLEEFPSVAASIKGLANLQFPKYNFSYVVLPHVAYQYSDSYRLIFINPSSIIYAPPSIADTTVLLETVFRQLTYDSFSVSKWNEICLRDGLIQFFKRVWQKRAAIRHGRSFVLESLEQVCSNRTFSLTEETDRPLIDATRCQFGAEAFYRGFSNTFGLDAMRNLVRNLMDRYPNETISLSQWSEEMAEVAGYPKKLQLYAWKYFQQSTSLALFLNFSSTTNKLDVKVRLTEEHMLPVPLRVYYALQPEPVTIIVNEYEQVFLDADRDPWALVDPDGDTCTVKIYDGKTLSILLDPDTGDIYNHLNKKRREGLVANFCFALMNRLILYDGNDVSVEWRNVFKYAYNLNASCKCCLVPRTVTEECKEEKLLVCDRFSYFKSV